MSDNVFTYYLTTNDIKLIKNSFQAHIHQCENVFKSLTDNEAISQVETQLKELNE